RRPRDGARRRARTVPNQRRGDRQAPDRRRLDPGRGRPAFGRAAPDRARAEQASGSGRRQPLMPESDKVLLRRYHEEGDLSAREQLIEQYMSLVRSLARRYAYRGEQLDDLVQIGAIGLIKAID